MRYYLTFGQKYRREEHPSGKHVHPDGYVVIVAEDYHAARDIVEQLYGRHWADLRQRSPRSAGPPSCTGGTGRTCRPRRPLTRPTTHDANCLRSQYSSLCLHLRTRCCFRMGKGYK